MLPGMMRSPDSARAIVERDKPRRRATARSPSLFTARFSGILNSRGSVTPTRRTVVVAIVERLSVTQF
jgi:hypothetical protein